MCGLKYCKPLLVQTNDMKMMFKMVKAQEVAHTKG